MSPLSWFLVSSLLLCLATVGHLALWVTVFNLLHATALSHRTVERLEKPIQLAVIGMPLWLAYEVYSQGQFPWEAPSTISGWILLGYLVACWLVAVAWGGEWLFRRHVQRGTARLISNDTSRVDVAAELGERPLAGFTARTLDYFPFNEVLVLQVHEKTLVIPHLNPALDGLRIAHLSDLHFTGKIGKPFFDYVIDRVNDWHPDLAVVTGDIVDKTACQNWLPSTLGRVKAREGKFFVLGNHDLRVASVEQLRHDMDTCDFRDLGGLHREITIRGAKILLAGNERPWFDGLPNVPTTDHSGDGVQPLRVLLAHTPDQFGWARRHQFDLMLAGHTHGGQIQLPLIGPVVAPSRHGVKYASGVFYREPTLMHVSRGVSGLQPIRWNCPPELALLTLTRGPNAD